MPKEEPENDLCRCCHAEGSFKNLYESHSWMDVEEVVYSKLLQDCFEIEMAPVTQPLQHMLCTICETCIERLQDAVKFKRQVLKCEKRFRDVYGSCVGKESTYEVKVKQEVELDLKDDTFNGESSKTSALADSFRGMDNDDDDDDDDDGFGDREDDNSKSTGNVRVKEEVDDSDSDDNICLKDMSKLKKRKAKGSSPSAAQKKPKATTGGEKTGDHEELEVIQGVSFIRVKATPPRRDIDFKTIEDQVQCLRCPAVLKNESSFYCHYRRNYEPTYKCPNCIEIFCTLVQLTRHKLEKHNIDNRLKCNACDRDFYSIAGLNVHGKRFHKLGKAIPCEDCDFVTYYAEHMKTHVLCHSNVKNYQCQYCQKTFKRRPTMLLHERIHVGDKRKVCSVCEQAFVQRASLKYHMNKHHPGVDF